MQSTLVNTVVVVVVAMVGVMVEASPHYHLRPQPSYSAHVCHPSTVTITNTEVQQVTVSNSLLLVLFNWMVFFHAPLNSKRFQHFFLACKLMKPRKC